MTASYDQASDDVEPTRNSAARLADDSRARWQGEWFTNQATAHHPCLCRHDTAPRAADAAALAQCHGVVHV